MRVVASGGACLSLGEGGTDELLSCAAPHLILFCFLVFVTPACDDACSDSFFVTLGHVPIIERLVILLLAEDDQTVLGASMVLTKLAHSTHPSLLFSLAHLCPPSLATAVAAYS